MPQQMDLHLAAIAADAEQIQLAFADRSRLTHATGRFSRLNASQHLLGATEVAPAPAVRPERKFLFTRPRRPVTKTQDVLSQVRNEAIPTVVKLLPSHPFLQAEEYLSKPVEQESQAERDRGGK